MSLETVKTCPDDLPPLLEVKNYFIREIKQAVFAEFPSLEKCHKVDFRFLWETDGVLRYRVNGWMPDGIIFTCLLVAWKGDDGVQYEIKDVDICEK